MDQEQYKRLAQALSSVPDPRCRRGRLYSWELVVVLMAAAMISGQNHIHAIGQWVKEHTDELLQLLQPPRGSLPSEATLRRGLNGVDIFQLEQILGKFDQTLAARSRAEALEGLSMDGKQLRGANAHGEKVHLMSLATHSEGIVIDQVQVEEQTNEISSAPRLLGGHSLSGFVVTGDAIFGQKELARQIIAQGGEYILQIKANQPQTYEAIAETFTDTSFVLDTNVSSGQGHGRNEKRSVWTSTALNGWLETELSWVGVGQVVKRCCERESIRTGHKSVEDRYAIISLTPQQADAATIGQYWRGHWSIENKLHYVRDVSMGEDQNQCHTGNAPHAMAAIRNALLALLRHDGWKCIPDALRHFQASVRTALEIIGALPAQ